MSCAASDGSRTGRPDPPPAAIVTVPNTSTMTRSPLSVFAEGNHVGRTGGSQSGVGATRRGGSGSGGEVIHSWEKGDGPTRRAGRGPPRKLTRSAPDDGQVASAGQTVGLPSHWGCPAARSDETGHLGDDGFVPHRAATSGVRGHTCRQACQKPPEGANIGRQTGLRDENRDPPAMPGHVIIEQTSGWPRLAHHGGRRLPRTG